MNRKARLLLILAALGVMALLYLRPISHRSPGSAPLAEPANKPPAAFSSLASQPPRAPQPSSAAQPGQAALDPADPAALGPRYLPAVASAAQSRAAENDPALQTVAFAVRDYLAAFGQVPVGSNPEITRALMGDNARNAHYLRAELPINAQGELLDRWGTPYFFHQISRSEIDLYSAGPDRTMWTSDDEITR